jgi:hypothetical protein
MTVKKIVEERLRKDGFDGLCCDGCGCRVDDLMPCGDVVMDCVPGHCKWGTFDGEQTWRIFAPPPVQSDQSPDEDRREKSESRAGIPSFELRGPTNH